MQRFELVGRAGAGANSTVLKCRDTASGSFVAVKKIEGAVLSLVLKEAAIMRACAHKHVVELLEVHHGVSGSAYIVTAFIDHSLAREINLNPRGLPLPRAKLVAHQLAEALEQVHSKQVCHCDIKPANILLTAHGYCVKLCDFGSSQTMMLDTDALTADGAGSPAPSAVSSRTAAASRWYCAPESLLGGEATPASDVWALGCVLAELVTGKPLLPGSEEELDQLCWIVAMIGGLSPGQESLLRLLPAEQRQRVEAARARAPMLDRIPRVAACPELADALRACLQPDPALRPTAQQVQQLPFFEDLRAALRASEEAAAAAAGASAFSVPVIGADAGAGAGASAPGACLGPSPFPGGACSPFARSSTCSAEMDVDLSAAVVAAMTSGGAGASPDCVLPYVAASSYPTSPEPPTAAELTAADSLSRRASGGAGCATGAGRPSGVQAAVPVRPAPRVSALTGLIRGRPFEGEGSYADLMPAVQQLAGRWAPAEASVGPIAMAARRACSASLASSLASARNGEALARWPMTAFAAGGSPQGAIAAAVALAVGAEPFAALLTGGTPTAATPPPHPVPEPMPIAAAAIAASAGSAARAATPATAAADPSPMECTPAQSAINGLAAAAAAPSSIPISSSVGAVPYMSQASGLAAGAPPPPALEFARPRAPSATQLRSRAIINRARRYAREAAASSPVPAYLTSSCPRPGLGSSATLIQRELAAAAEGSSSGRHGASPAKGPGLAARASGHAMRRSYADLTDLASVAEYAPLDCETPPEVKRRRAAAGGGMYGWYGSPGSQVTEGSLGSLPEHEPGPPQGWGGAGAGGGRSRMRRSSSGFGVGTGSPVRGPVWGQATAARAASQPQPISVGARQRCFASPLRGVNLASSLAADVVGSAASELVREVI